jgi:DNA polymerase III delta prime subunit
VILDEVDYMTKNAQQALKYLLQSSLYNVRFCLICNYISKIDESLKNEFVSIRFNQLPDNEIFHFLKKVAEKESIDLTDTAIRTIQTLYQSDIRSMINFIQLHQDHSDFDKYIIVDSMWQKLHELFENGNISIIYEWIHNTSISCNLDIKTIIKHYFNYMILHHSKYIVPTYLNIMENIVHNYDTNIEHILYYFVNHVLNEYNKKLI